MSDEVSDFLRSVELLKERRDVVEDSKELEEKILQEKRERQARRLERARSISPQKSSPANTPPPAAHRVGILPSAADGTTLESPIPASPGTPINMAADPSSSPTKENDSPFDLDPKRTSVPPSPSMAMPSARGGLSWQRRPTSQDRPKSRPLSMVAAENAARIAPGPASASAEEPTLSREQIAQTLASKDPSWFRQTQDPGRGAGAFRKSQVEDQDTVDHSSARTQLPGMARSSVSEPKKEDSDLPATPSKVAPPLSLTGTPRLDPPAGENTESGEPASAKSSASVSPGRTSPTRPVSPTKGMGGFVQSAMMKRSDSVKRWSVNSPAGLQRVDPTRTTTTSSLDRPTTPVTSVRPKSIIGMPSEFAPAASADDKEPQAESQPAAAALGKATDDGKTTPPVSPSKTMDPRRWSPTKGSWLEAALNKPESPKAKPAAAAPAQPAWMVELNKAKAQKTSADLARSASVAPKKPEIKTGGLMRSTPMGADLKPSALSGLPTVPTVPATEKPAIASLRGTLRKTSPATEGSGSAQSDTSTTAKPDVPSKPSDFRANLKPRAPPPQAGETSTPTDPANELKSVFGTLRRAKTQSYVAPDELKDNILRGKAALHVTGGPKKTEHVDEFKEAILKKKDEFKKAQEEGRSVTRERGKSFVAEQQQTLPEGIAKRLELQRTGTLRGTQTQTSAEKEAQEESRSVTRERGKSFVAEQQQTVPEGIAKRLELQKTGTLRGAQTQTAAEKEATTTTSTSSATLPVRTQKSSEALGRVGGKVGGLAERFNPALAGLIARGPPPMAAGPKGSGAGAATTSQADDEQPTGPGPQLTHLTKNRARGPKRKAPSTVPSAVKEAQASATEKPATPTATLGRFEPKAFPFPKAEESKPEQLKPEKPVISPKPGRFALTPTELSQPPKADSDVISLVDSSRRLPKEEPKSAGQPVAVVGSTPVKTRPRSPTKVHEQVAALTALSQQSPKLEPSGDATSQPPSPKKLDLKRMSRFLSEESQPSPVIEPTKPASPTKERSNSVKSRPASPVKDRFPALFDNASMKQPEPEPKPAPLALRRQPTGGSGLVSAGLSNASPFSRSAEPRPLDDRPAPLTTTSTTSASRPLPTPPSIASPPPTSSSSPRRTSPIRASTKSPSSDVTSLIDDFFGPSRPARKHKYTADAAEILSLRPASAQPIQTQRAQLLQLSKDGKKSPVPAHHERVLFEREMYLLPHTYVDASGRRWDEVYFWAGDEVPQADVEDASLFAAREARGYGGGRLVRMRQGKETAEFLQALGGVVITRRGERNKFDSLSPAMLCGRRYMGQVVFDEVDFTPQSLCSGFVYLVVSPQQGGRCWLWKGRGSSVEEISCARLVGMEMAPTGELVEVDEGMEQNAFWNVFGAEDGRGRWPSADHWRLKGGYERYGCRLFGVEDAASPVTEIAPFSQHDLSPSNIYVLDAFFELYILVGARSKAKYPAFRNALDFAQEYAILAAGMEDRPFVPVSTIVLEGIPRDLKACFRKWRDELSPTIMHPPSNPPAASPSGSEAGGRPPSPLKRGRSLRIVPLTQALQALSNE